MIVDKNTHVIKMAKNIPSEEMPFRLQKMFTPDESAAILYEIHQSEDGCYNDNPGFCVIYSGVMMGYTIFVSNFRYLPLVEPLEARLCSKPKSLRTEVEELVMWNGKCLEERDVDYIMNCRLICKQNPSKADRTAAGLVWTLARTIIQLEKQLKAKIKTKEPAAGEIVISDINN